jgi:hypothetical protein
MATTIAFLVIGPAFLIHRRRHPVEPEPKDEVAQTREDIRHLRLAVAFNLVLCAGALVLAFARPHDMLEGRKWSVALLLYAGVSLAGAFRSWAVADLRATGRTARWAWAGAGIVDAGVGVAAVIAAVGNQLGGWLGGRLGRPR